MRSPIPIQLITKEQLTQLPPSQQAWLKTTGFTAEPGTYGLIPGTDGELEKVVVGRPDPLDLWALGTCAQALPPHTYKLDDALSADESTQLALGWHLGQYQFTRYKKGTPLPSLEFPSGGDRAYVDAAVEATTLVRDLINTPAADLGPTQLEAQARSLANTYDAHLTVIGGDDLLTHNYPMIHAVGKASVDAPRLLDLRWGQASDPAITLVGKGVCFDTGGLDVKSSAGMKTMKKDMGGAAQVLGLALMVMKLKLPVYLRVLIPAVENSIAGNAMHPLDVLPSRKGLTVEVGNTDAEGRLVLADALWEASQDNPKLIIDCATLTGAARVALGTELPAFFCNHSKTAEILKHLGQKAQDPLWELPLHSPYRDMLSSKVADLNNISNASYGGAITAALFLQEFVKPGIPWVHIDLMAWNLRSLPGRPEGGEAMGMRSLLELIRSAIALR
ncbi:MAG: leucyl aminopeptidase family protein [Elainellaceae cyanobacterium]